jgi:enoyl-CoA hydratase/carnithine racemase
MNRVAAENVLEVEVSAGIAKVTLTRPNILNAVNRRVRNELAQAFDRLAADEAVRVVILTGAGEEKHAHRIIPGHPVECQRKFV